MKDETRVGNWAKGAMGAGVLVAVVACYWLLRDRLSLGALADQEERFRSLVTESPLTVYAGAFAVYVLVTGLSLPGAAAMSLVIGWLFGFWKSLLLVSFASTTGATVAFLLSRYLLQDVVQRRFGDRLRTFNESLSREGSFYLFSLRLIPAVPFFVINIVMGLTSLPVRTFWWVSQLGMLPGTAAYVYAGSTVPSLRTLADSGAQEILRTEVLVALAILGLVPLLLRWLMKRYGRSTVKDNPGESGRAR